MALPDLSVALTAKTDGFETALNRAAKASEDTARRVQESTDRMSSGLSILKGAAEGALAALTIDKLVTFITSTIDAGDHLYDLSNKTGIAVETIGGFGFAAKQAGSSVEGVSNGLAKLNLQLAGAASGNKRAQEAFDALGISVKTASGATISADAAFIQIANRFATFNEGAEKSALAVRLFGKSGADLIQVLDQGGQSLQDQVDYYKRYSGVTQDLAEKSNQFNDTLTKINLLSGAFANTLAALLLPTLQAVADQLVESKEKGTAFKSAAEGIADVFNLLVITGAKVVFAFEETGRSIGAVVAKAQALATLDFKGFTAISEAADEDGKKAKASLDKFVSDVKNAKSSANATTPDQTPKKDAPRLPGTTAKSGPTVDLDKKLLDQNLKDLDIYIGQEKERYTDRTTFLQLDYQRNRISLSDYFDGRQQARDVDLKNTQAAYDKEIQAERDYIAKQNAADPKGQAKIIDANTKIAELQEKSRKAGHEAAIEEVKDTNAREVALEQYGDQLSGLQAQIASLRGDTAKSFTISFDIQNRNLSEKIDANLKSSDPATAQAAEAAKANLATLRQQGLVNASLSDQEQQRSKIMLELQNAQERVNLAVSSGKKTELEGLADLSAANRARIADLQKVINAEQAIAESSQDPAALARVDALRVEMEKLGEQTDLVADKFRSIGENAFETALNKLTSGTGKVKDIFKALVTDINTELLKVGNKEIAQQLFKKDGAIGQFLSQFGLSGASPSGALAGSGGTASLATFSTSITAANEPLLTLATAAQAAATALSQVGGTSLASASTTTSQTSLLGSLFGKIGSYFSGSANTNTANASASALSSNPNYFSSQGVTPYLALGGVLDRGNLMPFADGGVVNRATLFPMASGGMGVMGEAGPEAIVPLKRGRDGRLGIASTGGSSNGDTFVTHINNTIQDVHARQSQSQLVSTYSRAIDKRKRTRSA